jgi:hypothetical protein
MRRAVALLFALAALTGLAACGDGDKETESAGQAETRANETEQQGGKPDGAGAGGSGENGTGGSKTKEAPVATIVVRGGKPVGGVRELEYSAGSPVRFRVRSDVADEVHVHGYELMEEVRPGGTVAFSFSADIEGIFEVELEGQQEQIAELRVNP